MRPLSGWAGAAVPAPPDIVKPFETKAIASVRRPACPEAAGFLRRGAGVLRDWAPRLVTPSRLACRNAPVCRCEESRGDGARAGRAGGWAGGPARRSNWGRGRGAFARSPRRTCTRRNRSARRESPAANPDRSTHSRVGSPASSSPSARTRGLIALRAVALALSGNLFSSGDSIAFGGFSPRTVEYRVVLARRDVLGLLTQRLPTERSGSTGPAESALLPCHTPGFSRLSLVPRRRSSPAAEHGGSGNA
jgi:hypothetical protein